MSERPESAASTGRMRIPRSRRLVVDVLHLDRHVPTTLQSRLIDVSRLIEVRRELPVRISWPVIIIKAYARVCSRNARLLQSWRSFPWPHIYQHAAPVATVAVRREYRGDDWLLWANLQRPHELALESLQSRLDRFIQEPVEMVFRRQLRLSALPTPLRRFIWWWNLNLAGEKQAKRLGTFLMTSVAGLGSEGHHPPGFLTSALTDTPFDDKGRLNLKLAYDHRLMDGAFVSERLVEIDEELNGAVLEELSEHGKSRAIRQAAA